MKWTVGNIRKNLDCHTSWKKGKIKVLPKNIISEVKFPVHEKNNFLQKVITQFPMIKVFEVELLSGKFELKKKLIYDESLIIFPVSKI